MAKFDIDGYRIDTVKYVDPDRVEQFGNAMREFALSIGKRNFFTFGEIYDDSWICQVVTACKLRLFFLYFSAMISLIGRCETLLSTQETRSR
jgi:hypothetical protein